MTTHKSTIALRIPAHSILYTGLSRTEADRVSREARRIGREVIRSAKPVTGSSRRIWHYTIIAV